MHNTQHAFLKNHKSTNGLRVSRQQGETISLSSKLRGETDYKKKKNYLTHAQLWITDKIIRRCLALVRELKDMFQAITLDFNPVAIGL